MLDVLICKECGARPRGMKLCHDLFDDLLGIKYSGNGYGYRLALTCYTFQHPQSHTASAWTFAKYYLESVVHYTVAPSEAKEHAQVRFDAASNKEETQLRDASSITWTRTIADFTGHFLQDPLQEAIDWAHTILQDYEKLYPWNPHLES